MGVRSDLRGTSVLDKVSSDTETGVIHRRVSLVSRDIYQQLTYLLMYRFIYPR